MKDKIFREYDIRGKYNEDLDNETAYKIGLGYGSYLQEHLNCKECVVGRDGRLSSNDLHKYLLKGLTETGLTVYDYGLITTPMHYYTRMVNNMLGIMITASHNPKDENGFKFSFDKYANARGKMVKEFASYINKGKFLKGEGKVINKDITEEYINYVISHIKLGKKRIKVVLDPANGAACNIAKEIYSKLNLDLIMINDTIDGNFPNHHPDPSIEENLDELKKKVLETKADIGISFDGDADRIGIVDELGNMVSIESYAVIIVRNIIDKVKNKKFLYDAKSSDIFKDEVLRLKGTPVISRTATSYTEYTIKKENIPFGFQYVGHISFNDRQPSTESAMISSLRIIEILSKTDKTISELISTVPKYFTSKEERIPSKDETKYDVIKKIQKYCDEKKYKYMEIDGLKIIFKDGWAYVRASNTGPTINLRCESKNKKDLDNLLKIFRTLIDLYNK